MPAKRLAALLFVAALTLVACVNREPPGLLMRRLPADLVFGVPPLQEPVAPGGAATAAPTEEEEPEEFVPNPTVGGAPPPSAVAGCRQAGPNDFPSEEAPVMASGRPQGGVYSWKQSGEEHRPGFPFPIPLAPIVDREVQRVRTDPVDRKVFTFQTVERDPRPGTQTLIKSTFRVDTTNPSANLRGVFLTRLTNDPAGKPPRVFNPTPPGILYLPMPVRQGREAEFQSVGVDANSLQTMRHTGFVKERFRVDACGTVVDSWLVEAEQVIAGAAETITRTYRYAIATQFGGLIIHEHAESPSGNPDLVYDTNIAQTEPDPNKPGLD